MNICVFCAATEQPEKYSDPARKLAELIGANGHNLVWGGSNSGTMGIMASGVQNAGGKIFGVSVELLREKARENATEMHFAKDIAERKVLLQDKGDAFIALAGGIGTLDEVFTILEQKKHNLHNKKIILLNSDGFYDGLKLQMKRMQEEGFFPKRFEKLDDLVIFTDTPEEVIDILSKND